MNSQNPKPQELSPDLLAKIRQEAMEMESVTAGRVKAADWEKMLRAGSLAWGSVPDAAKWVSELRNGPGWTQAHPTEPGAYWHWDGEDTSDPEPVIVLKDYTSNRHLVRFCRKIASRELHCDECGGWWMRMETPARPSSG